MLMEQNVMYSIIIYLSFMFILYMIKPDISFDYNGDIKEFGLGKKNNTTIFPIYIIAIIPSIIYLYVSNLLQLN